MKYKIRKELIINKNQKKTQIFLPDKSEIISLNEIASFIFRRIEKGEDDYLISKKITKKYQISKKQAETDLKLFIKELKKIKLITVHHKRTAQN